MGIQEFSLTQRALFFAWLRDACKREGLL